VEAKIPRVYSNIKAVISEDIESVSMQKSIYDFTHKDPDHDNFFLSIKTRQLDSYRKEVSIECNFTIIDINAKKSILIVLISLLAAIFIVAIKSNAIEIIDLIRLL